jgi:uncharacterized protein YaiI (UPF0178 family)
MKILIDGDGCPVINLTINIAKENKIECILLSDTSHNFEKYNIKTITVSKGADSVDFALVNMLEKNDIVITQDYGLAAMCLAKQAIPINQNGVIYNNQNIDNMLFTRYISKKIRMAGGRTKGPSKRENKNDEIFEKNLEELIKKAK